MSRTLARVRAGDASIALTRRTFSPMLTRSGMKCFSTTFTIATDGRTELADVTKHVRAALQQLPVSTGIALVTGTATTSALLVHEFSPALVADLKRVMEHLVPDHVDYRHDDPRHLHCERQDASAHLRAALLGRSVSVGVAGGELVLGDFDSIIFAEFDGPRTHEIAVQVIGE